MRILVLGGTGRTGSLVTRLARSAGHELTLLVRDPSLVSDAEGTRVLVGDATDRDAVGRALKGQDALISALGAPSVFRSNIATPAASTFVPLAEAEGLRRVIVMSAFGVGTTYDQSSLLVRVAFSTVLRGLYRDKTTADEIVRRSSLDWTIVHPVSLTDGVGTNQATASEHLTKDSRTTVTRADVAAFLITCLATTHWSRKTVIVTS